MKITTRSFILTVAAALLLSGCSQEYPPVPPPPASNVFLMYDNIGGTYFDDNVKAAGKAVAAGALREGQRVIVYHRSYRAPEATESRSTIYELVRDASQDAGFRREVLMQYAEGENATLSKETIASVVDDVHTFAPAEHYGLAFGSHGMGWIPKIYPGSTFARRSVGGQSCEYPFAELWTIPENPPTRYLAYSESEKIDVAEFADALDEWSWDFIIFDDCFMASVEALYEMRHLADHFIASPTEIMIAGFPYDRVVSTIFKDWTNLAGVADAFVEAYRAGQMSSIRSATVAVVKSSELDALAETVRRLNLQLDELTSDEGIQYYEGFTRPGHAFYDLDDYLNTIRAGTMPTEYNAFKAQLEKTVVFKDHTERFFSAYPRLGSGTNVTVTHFSGLNVFIPWSPTAFLIPDYRQTGWYKYVYAK